MRIDLGEVRLEGILESPPGASSTVIFAHGSGSSRLSPRNQYVASALYKRGLGTLLFDLLTKEEDQRSYENRFNIDLLTERLIGATGWLMKQPGAGRRTVGYFGASTGAAGALRASFACAEAHAVVSRGGRPDLAREYLGRVTAPTLLIVGGRDEEVLAMNREALEMMTAAERKELLVVRGATHLFEEPGTLEEVARAATDWFVRFLD